MNPGISMHTDTKDAYSTDLVRLMALAADAMGMPWPQNAPALDMQPQHPLARTPAAHVDALWQCVAHEEVVPLCREMVAQTSVFDFGAMPAAVISCSSQQEALQCLPRYLPLLCSLIEIDMVIDANVVLIRLRKNAALHWCTEVFFLTLLVRLNSLLMRLPTMVSGVLIAQTLPAATEEALQDHFGSVVVGQSACTGIITDPAVLSENRPCYSQLVHDTQRALADAALAELVSPLGLRIRDVVRSLIQNQEEVSVERVASAIHMSSRTMQRKLKRKGRTLTDYVNLVRKDMAKNALIATDTGISSIARDLGFQSTSSFSKFFTQQTGISPREYRKQQTL